MPSKLIILGITGGIASGKSTVARMFQQLGAKIINADRIAHRVIEKSSVKSKLIKTYGPVIVNKRGEINRPTLARLAFRHRENLNKLNLITHAAILKGIRRKLQQIRKNYQGTSRVIVTLDAALLMEGRLAKICDRLVFVKTSFDQRTKRATKKRDWPTTELKRRERFQCSLESKENKSDFIVKNSGSLTATCKQVKNIISQIKNRR